MSVLNYIKLPLVNMGILKPPQDPSVTVSYLQYDPYEKEKLLRVCNERKTFSILYSIEFNLANQPSEHTFEAAQLEENIPKNRNPNVLPYDYNRVILTPDDAYPSDYINASYINSLIEENHYIVTQGPLEETVDDFWRMIWEQHVTCIVMLTKCFDFTKKMCTQYWSGYDFASYGPIKVLVESCQTLANYEIRVMRIWHSTYGEQDIRSLIHFSYSEWPCYANAFIPALMDFRRRVRQMVAKDPVVRQGKTLIHCNDGAGRSGVYVAIDANIDMMEQKGYANVFGYLRQLKAARNGLVETEAQLKFIYEALEEYLICQHTWFSVNELSQRIQKYSEPKCDEFKREYQLICRLTPLYTIGDCAGSYRTENRMKNRDISVITPDNFRPYLTSYQGCLDTDFINASFIDTYKEAKSCIVTEWPLPETIKFFWSLVYDYNVSAIVVLSTPEKANQYPSFWPDDRKSEMYGPVFTVDQLSHSHMDYIRTWIFEINKKIISLTDLMTGVKAEVKKCQLFQVTNWPMGDKVPSTPASLVDLMILVERWRIRNDNGPVLIVSHDGKSRVGIYCAAVSCIEQIRLHGEVDVFTTMRTLRRFRPKIMPFLTEYKYIYQVVLHYVLQCLQRRRTKKPKEVEE